MKTDQVTRWQGDRVTKQHTTGDPAVAPVSAGHPVTLSPCHLVIFLIGYRCTGKTTVARLLADRLGWGWRDADLELERRHGSIRRLFAEEGEAGFRDKEAAVLAELCAAPRQV